MLGLDREPQVDGNISWGFVFLDPHLSLNSESLRHPPLSYASLCIELYI
ncbi:hypothetical protein SB6411_00586 [Klebsiella spallanzanii]|uniref:Uncharacterized protein n=1 Tax=Klebsiella spallanzanii TaxID=2587528 RepID=A0ABY6V643_9ENTR|nr:hypothetical protein SB6411_00586 [Klebsiella spallanzanii]